MVRDARRGAVRSRRVLQHSAATAALWARHRIEEPSYPHDDEKYREDEGAASLGAWLGLRECSNLVFEVVFAQKHSSYLGFSSESQFAKRAFLLFVRLVNLCERGGHPLQ